MEYFEIVPVVGIAFLCYLVGKGLKAWEKFDDRKIPVLMGVCGAGLGVVAFFVERSLIGTGGILSAVITGAFSGWSATGVDQIAKQSGKEA